MPRKSEREIERAIEWLEATLPPDHAAFGDEELTDAERERLVNLFRGPEDLDEREQRHLENIETWLAEADAPEDRTAGELMPAEKAWYELLLADDPADVTLPQQYYEQFPEAPRSGFGEGYA